MPQLISSGGAGGARGTQRQSAPPAQVVDVGREPSLKAAFLSGRIQNLAVPFIYHDPTKDIAYVLMPMDLNLRADDQQRVIGQLMNAVQRGMPKEQVRAYLLNPRTFFTLQSLMEAVLEKDGVTREMLDAQREKSDFLRDLLRLTDADAQRELIRKNEPKVDAAVFEMLGMNMDAAAQSGREDVYKKLIDVEKLLVEESSYGKRLGERNKVVEALQKTPTRENLLELLVTEEDSQTRQMLIGMGRQLLDYSFFQQLSSRVDAAQDPLKKARLSTLRKEIQDTRLDIEKAQREALQAKAQLINKILTSNKPTETMHANADQIDETFLSVVEANLAEARKRGQGEDIVRGLESVFEMGSQIIASRQPAEVQIVQALLAAKYPDETRQILEEVAEMSDSRFIQFMGQFAEQLASQDRTDLSAKLTQIMIQARGIWPQAADDQAPLAVDAAALETSSANANEPAATDATPKKKKRFEESGGSLLLGGNNPPKPPAGGIEIVRR